MPDTAPIRWRADRTIPKVAWPIPKMPVALGRGFMGRCPACGRAPIFATWLRVVDCCAACTAPLGRVPADDAPPYFVIFIVGHIVVGTLVMLDRAYRLSILTETLIFVPLALGLALSLIRPVKGATVGLMLRLGLDLKPDPESPESENG